ncbi:low temperature requirement protein A [Plantactinospora endophytica]|uniref:Membrane protein n=1 Tax=Plantactinospora endophytica TaxID=673535 RepID=A0ABQ4DWF3_9ACTN|nr:low temperature requirement protein A [Plantactinospora endophytica]GIG86782.1 membrane protein [Plantactinospora endophytica]
MADTPADPVLRAESSSQRATFLELFLDLVFVFALTRVSQRLVEDFTTDQRILLSEAGQTLVLFLALWLIWASTAWVTSTLEPEAFAVQGVVVVTVVCSMVVAVTLPQGFGEGGLIFVAGYLAVQFVRVGFFLIATRGRVVGDPAAPRRVLFWAGLTAVPWLIGGMAGESLLRGVLWSVAVGVDYLGFTLGWPTPRLGRSEYGAQPFAGEHLAERYQQFLLIGLGELILVTGVAFSSGGGAFEPGRTGALGLALLTTVLLWRIYFYRAGHVLPAAIIKSRDPTRLGLAATYTHLTMIAGIVLTGVGYELSITHPFGHIAPAWLIAILGGPALFLVGRAGFEFLVFGRISRSRVIGLVLLAAAVPVVRRLPLVAVAGTTAGVLLGVALSDLRRSHGKALEAPAPPI